MGLLVACSLVPSEMHFDTDRKQPGPTALTTPGQNRASSLGFHAGPKPELTFAGSLGRLIRTFHDSGSGKSGKDAMGERRCQTLV